MSDGEVEQKRRRRRSRSSNKKDGGWIAYWQGPDFGRHLFVGMAILGVIYAGMVFREVRLASFQYSGLTVGDSESQVRYMLGQPTSTSPDRTTYYYDDKGTKVTARFGPTGNVATIKCSQERFGEAVCPSILGIRIGDVEDVIPPLIGKPDRESFPGDDKVMHYDGLGVSYYLRRYEVVAMEINGGSGFSGYFPRALWKMIP